MPHHIYFSNSSIYSILSAVVSNNRKYEKSVSLPLSNTSFDTVRLLLRCNGISSYSVNTSGSNYFIRAELCYPVNKPKLFHLNFVSRPGRRFYVGLPQIRRLLASIPASILVLYSRYGLVLGREALALGTGGELICIIN